MKTSYQHPQAVVPDDASALAIQRKPRLRPISPDPSRLAARPALILRTSAAGTAGSTDTTDYLRESRSKSSANSRPARANSECPVPREMGDRSAYRDGQIQVLEKCGRIVKWPEVRAVISDSQVGRFRHCKRVRRFDLKVEEFNIFGIRKRLSVDFGRSGSRPVSLTCSTAPPDQTDFQIV
ncbi:hypothetical protein [Burkholderia pseudomallei]|uniref:hypothetical protein n=1 Tax=Burkholderia pseudomallei TaxID=28450 RepID=UPI0012AED559|nr:hypothetical protein [Burkholderia pseudomallei]MBM5589057.1 hypothetical protein [Burkholderia pseudomallei]